MIKSKKTPGRRSYGAPFIGPMDHTLTVPVKLNGLTAAEVDSNGYIKPSIPFKIDGGLCNGAAGEYVYGASVEAVDASHLTGANPTNASLAALPNSAVVPVAVGLIGIYNRPQGVDNLGRALSPNEEAAFLAPGCKLAISR